MISSIGLHLTMIGDPAKKSAPNRERFLIRIESTLYLELPYDAL